MALESELELTFRTVAPDEAAILVNQAVITDKELTELTYTEDVTTADGTQYTTDETVYEEEEITKPSNKTYRQVRPPDTMFGTLANYKEQAYCDEHPEMILYTPGTTYLVEMFAGYIVQIDGGDLPCFQMVFEDDVRFLEFIADAKAKSVFQADVEIGSEDRIITLSTCTYEVYNARYVVHGKLTLIAGEESEMEPDEKIMGLWLR